MLRIEQLPHDNVDEETEHFANVLADALIASEVEPDRELCERWLREGFVDENELEAVLEAFERKAGYE